MQQFNAVLALYVLDRALDAIVDVVRCLKLHAVVVVMFVCMSWSTQLDRLTFWHNSRICTAPMVADSGLSLMSKLTMCTGSFVVLPASSSSEREANESATAE